MTSDDMYNQMFYYRDGSPITQGASDDENMYIWGHLHCNPRYKRVAETILADGTWISTVWLGLNHNYLPGPPLIFETMVFESEISLNDLEQVRYSTLAEAEAGHAAMVIEWEGRGDDERR